jgi:hypothetical protein
MKRISVFISVIIIAGIQLPILSQNPVVILDYMRVHPGMTSDYLEVEKEWKKIHQKRVEAGVTTGWQLWKKMFASPEDPYQYITINWFENFEKTFEENNPAGTADDLFTDEKWEALYQKTMNSRTNVKREVSHQLLSADNSEGSTIIVINRMQVEPGMENEYIGLEREIWKPYQEEAIKKDLRTHWGVWRNWPFNEGESTFITVDGYSGPAQMMTGEDILKDVHPDLTWEEVEKRTSNSRKHVSAEIWQLVDYVFPE